MELRACVRALFPAGVEGAELTRMADAAALWPEEERHVARAVEKRVAEFRAGRHCGREALSRLGAAPCAIPAEPDRSARWPAGFVGTITHCRGYCAAAVARASALAGIGLDAEERSRVPPKLWRSVATEVERAELEALGDAEALDRAALLFSAKEAFYKAQYPTSRAFIGFREARFQRLDEARFSVELLRDVDGLARAGAVFEGRYAFDGPLVFAALAIASRG